MIICHAIFVRIISYHMIFHALRVCVHAWVHAWLHTMLYSTCVGRISTCVDCRHAWVSLRTIHPGFPSGVSLRVFMPYVYEKMECLRPKTTTITKTLIYQTRLLNLLNHSTYLLNLMFCYGYRFVCPWYVYAYTHGCIHDYIQCCIWGKPSVQTSKTNIKVFRDQKRQLFVPGPLLTAFLGWRRQLLGGWGRLFRAAW